MKKARVILVDPPWTYRNRHASRKDNPGKKTRFGIGVAERYSMGVMTLEDLTRLGPLIAAVAADDAYLFMWTTRPTLPVGLNLVHNWGFLYRQMPFTWYKEYPNGSQFCGGGAYGFTNPEDVILGRYPGTSLWHSNKGWKPRSFMHSVASRYLPGDGDKHSRKPEQLQDDLERWLGPHIGDGTWLELFGTRERPGWHCLGGSLSGRDIKTDLKDLARRMAD